MSHIKKWSSEEKRGKGKVLLVLAPSSSFPLSSHNLPDVSVHPGHGCVQQLLWLGPWPWPIPTGYATPSSGRQSHGHRHHNSLVKGYATWDECKVPPGHPYQEPPSPSPLTHAPDYLYPQRSLRWEPGRAVSSAPPSPGHTWTKSPG